MSSFSRLNSWLARTSNYLRRSTAGDNYHLGALDYTQCFPCPNGLPLDGKRYEECEATRRRVERAKRFIEQHSGEVRVQVLAELITVEEVKQDIEDIRKWVNSRNRPAAE